MHNCPSRRTDGLFPDSAAGSLGELPDKRSFSDKALPIYNEPVGRRSVAVGTAVSPIVEGH